VNQIRKKLVEFAPSLQPTLAHQEPSFQKEPINYEFSISPTNT